MDPKSKLKIEVYTCILKASTRPRTEEPITNDPLIAIAYDAIEDAFRSPQQPSSPFTFYLNQNVLNKEVQRPGKIEALTIDFLGPQYRIAYWDNSERKTVWLHADEIQAR